MTTFTRQLDSQAIRLHHTAAAIAAATAAAATAAAAAATPAAAGDADDVGDGGTAAVLLSADHREEMKTTLLLSGHIGDGGGLCADPVMWGGSPKRSAEFDDSYKMHVQNFASAGFIDERQAALVGMAALERITPIQVRAGVRVDAWERFRMQRWSV